jgi:hypothetical protein
VIQPYQRDVVLVGSPIVSVRKAWVDEGPVDLPDGAAGLAVVTADPHDAVQLETSPLTQ